MRIAPPKPRRPRAAPADPFGESVRAGVRIAGEQGERPVVEVEHPAGPPGPAAAPGRAAAVPRSTIRVLAAAGLITAVAVGFLAGHSGTELTRPDAASRPDAVEPVRTDRRPYAVASLAGVTLRLDHLRQDGDRVHTHFSALAGIDASLVREVYLDVRLEGSRFYTVDDATISARDDGFTVDFTLPESGARVRYLRITTVRLEGAASVPRLAWALPELPPLFDEPQVVRVGASVRYLGAEIRWTTLLLWRDRVEAVLDVTDLNRERMHAFPSPEFFYEIDGASPALSAGFASARESGNRIHLEFDGVPPRAAGLVLMLGAPAATVDGPWTWRLWSLRDPKGGP